VQSGQEPVVEGVEEEEEEGEEGRGVSSNASHIFIISPECVTIREDGCWLEILLLFLLRLRERTDKWVERLEITDETQGIREKIWGTRDKRRLTNLEEKDVMDSGGERRDERRETRGVSWYLFLSKRFKEAEQNLNLRENYSKISISRRNPGSSPS
jgi:hypothetical protein